MSQLLELDPKQLSDSFSLHPFAVRHGLVNHPLLTLDSIAELAETLDSGQVEQHFAANVRPRSREGLRRTAAGWSSSTSRATPSTGRSSTKR